MTTFLLLLTGSIVAAQWIHLAVRQRRNPRLRSHGPMEPQVVGLGTAFTLGALSWLCGLLVAIGLFGDDDKVTIGHALFGVAFAVIGSSLRVAAIERIGRGFSWGSAAPDVLVTDGIYRYLKHPLIAGYMCQVWALAISHPSGLAWSFGFLGICILLGWSIGEQVTKEERVLQRRFPEQWPAYSKGKLI
jgi:protein-S-isoprenylcysteine O-methyltransferase Ste14